MSYKRNQIEEGVAVSITRRIRACRINTSLPKGAAAEEQSFGVILAYLQNDHGLPDNAPPLVVRE
jgi:hypothetical protein